MLTKQKDGAARKGTGLVLEVTTSNWKDCETPHSEGEILVFYNRYARVYVQQSNHVPYTRPGSSHMVFKTSCFTWHGRRARGRESRAPGGRHAPSHVDIITTGTARLRSESDPLGCKIAPH
jgi:hypothetical protein